MGKLDALCKKSRFAAKVVSHFECATLPFFHDACEKMNATLDTYVDSKTKQNRRAVRQIKRDLLYSRLRFHTSLAQYFILHFEELSDKGRSAYVGEIEKRRYVERNNASGGKHDTFRDKYNTYQKFKPYYHRSVMQITSENRDEFLRFAEKNKRFILKYADEALGKGVQIIDQAELPEGIAAFFDRLIAENHRYIAEELIVQAPELMAIHPSSVNTVRFATYLKNNSVEHLFSFLRMGSGNGIIDNATAGGLAAAIDMESGVITSEACSESGPRMIFHPDTGVQILGMQMPRWQELLALVDELAHVVPEQKFVGWDLALTEQGWVMVEGNDDAMITAIQMCERRGLRERFDRAFKE